MIAAVPRYQRFSVDIKASGYGSDSIRIDTNDDVSQIQLEPLVLKVADQSVAGVVVDQDGKAVPEIRVSAYGKGQPYHQTKADRQGRFTVQGLVAGEVAIQANYNQGRRLHGRAQVQAGDQDVKIIAEERDSRGRRIPPKRKSLKGKPMPDWNDLGLSMNPEPFLDKPMLICFWAMEQRPSRRFVMQMTKQVQTLDDHGVGVLLVHVNGIEQETLDQWLKKNQIPFVSCIIQGDFEKRKGQCRVESLPWLILTDREHVVQAEGFGMSELDVELKQVTGMN